jgi:predicted RNA-binding protein with PUA-like domain
VVGSNIFNILTVLGISSIVAPAGVGVAKVAREAYPDPTAEEGDWSCVDLKPVRALKTPVTLDAIKGDPVLSEIGLIRQSRLSVMPLTDVEFARIAKLGSG